MEHGSKNTRVTRVTLSGGICKCSLSEIPVWRKKLLNLVHIYIFWEKCCKIRQLMNPLLQFMFYKRFYLVSMPNFLSPPISFTLLWKTNCMCQKQINRKQIHLRTFRSWGLPFEEFLRPWVAVFQFSLFFFRFPCVIHKNGKFSRQTPHMHHTVT